MRRKLFEFIVRYSGHIPDYLRESLGRDVEPPADDKSNRSVEHAALKVEEDSAPLILTLPM